MNYVNFRYGTPVTINPLSPELEPGTFTIDSSTLALYLDTDTGRVQLRDPLKLSLTGGTLTGDLIISSGGTTTSSISAAAGVIQGQFLETKGNIHLDVAPGYYAVIDANGRIRSRTKAEMLADMGLDNLGSLAFKDLASGVYQPAGRVTAPTVQVMTSTGKAITKLNPGILPSFVVFNETLELDEGELPSVEETKEVVLTIDSIQVSEPEFIGTTATITVG